MRAKIPFRYYVHIFLFLCFNGNPLFTSSSYGRPLLVAYVVIFVLSTQVLRGNRNLVKPFRRIFLLSSIVTILCFLQLTSLGSVSYPGVLALILKMFLAAAMLLYYEREEVDFFHLYIVLLSWLVVISLPFFAMNFVMHAGAPTDSPLAKSLLFYTSFDWSEERVRNSGMFWEPGAFAGYLNLALLFMLIRNGSFIIGRYRREAMWIVIGIISTLSTMGYVVLACLVVFYIIQNYPLGRVLLLPVVLAVSYYSYLKLPFLSEKIEEQYSVALEMSHEDISNQRFGAWKMDMQYINAEPLSGNGLHYTTRYRFHPWIDGDIGHGNGMSNFIVFWGIPFFPFMVVGGLTVSPFGSPDRHALHSFLSCHSCCCFRASNS